MIRLLTSTLLALAATCPAAAQDLPHAFVGAHVIPVEGPEIESGVLIVQGGRIVAVGSANAVDVPEGAVLHDVTGRVIMPGLICTHSHIGRPSGGDGSSPIQPEARVLDSVNVRSQGFKRALAGGLTTLNIMSGSGHLISGQTIYVKLRDGHTVEELVYRWEDGAAMGGLKMANGTNSQREAPFPGTRGKSASLVREKYIKAQEYMRKFEAAAGDPSKLPERDLSLEPLVEAMQGRRIVHHHTHRHDDVVTVLRLSKEFGFRVVLHHVSEGWKVAKEIAEANAPCSLILVDSPGGKLEAVDLIHETAAVLEKEGAVVAFHTDDWITDSRVFLRMPALGIRAGLSRETALRSVTINGAIMLDLDERIGSLTPGKDADFIVLSGDPFSVYTHVEQTWVEGVLRFNRADPADRLYATGGYGAGDDTKPYLCCQDEEGAVQ